MISPIIAAFLMFFAGTTLASTSRHLTITNGCQSEPAWIAHVAAGGVGPDPQNVKLQPGASYTFTVPDGLAGTRYWPKYRCDGGGNRCQIGESGGPGEICEERHGCAPAIDTKFEATFGRQGSACNPKSGNFEGCDWIDVSMVDGWTVPFRVEVHGDCHDSQNVIDCSGLSLSQCPSAENIDGIGSVDLRLKQPDSGQNVGCYSPCSKLTAAQWDNPLAKGHSPGDAVAAPYCCPTPPESPEACRSGPVISTQYVKMVHNSCPGVYAYAYDDGVGLKTCTPDSSYVVTFYCPPAKIHNGMNSTEAVWEPLQTLAKEALAWLTV